MRYYEIEGKYKLKVNKKAIPQDSFFYVYVIILKLLPGKNGAMAHHLVHFSAYLINNCFVLHI